VVLCNFNGCIIIFGLQWRLEQNILKQFRVGML
jgi:hypothetical protein